MTSVVDRQLGTEDYVPETQRVVELERREGQPPEAAVEKMTSAFQRPGSDRRLFPVQAQALIELNLEGGLLANMAVGSGKTLVALLAGDVLGIDEGEQLILHPADTRRALIREANKQAEHFRFDTSIKALSYTQLSRQDGFEQLNELSPSLVVADEAHKLANKKAARTKRLIRYFKANPDTAFVALSGTLTSKSITDYAHLAELALREKSPLPRAHSTIEKWAACLDVDDGHNWPEADDWREIQPLVDDELMDMNDQARKTTARAAFLDRLRSAPGVVMTDKTKVGASLRFRPLTCAPFHDHSKIDEALVDATERYILPNGEELDSPLDATRAARQLSCGFYYRWDWPGGEPDREWLRARREWNAAVRHVVRYGKTAYDSPAKAREAIERGEYDDNDEILAARRAWEQHRHKDEPPREAVWIDPTPVEHAQKIASEMNDEGRGVLVWYRWRAVANKLDELGMRVCEPNGHNPEALASDRPTAVSIHSHGRGLNLQQFDSNVIICPSPTGKIWEQVIGRTHRRGQDSDEVLVDVFAHTDTHVQAVQSAREDARYMQQTQDQPQKILYGDWTQIPGKE